MDNYLEVKKMQFVVLKKGTFVLLLLFMITFTAAAVWFFGTSGSVPASSREQNQNEQVREIHMVTGEFSTKTSDGKEIEAYRWDPGTVFVDKGEKVQLTILGVNGNEHPFMIEGTDIKGIVKKGEETTVPLQFHKEGIYRLICLTHSNKDKNGPMIAYIVVD
jgi:plastocyanin